MQVHIQDPVQFQDDSFYVGQWYRQKKHGHGLITWKNNKKYEGEFKDDLANGQGKFTDQNITYDGNWVNNKAEGYGEYTVSDWTYKGSWANDKPEGKGKLTFKDIEYDGEFHNGLKHG